MFSLLLSFLLIQTSNSLSCHTCGGAENVPKFAATVFSSLNITNSSALFGDCKGTSGSDVCTNGTFCIKRAKVYQIGYSGVSLKWTSYTKGCATLREDNSLVPTDTCYDLGQIGNSTGYTVRRLDCYCNKDFCNSSKSPFLSITLIMSILYFIV